MPYVLGSHAYDDHFQIPVVRSPLTRAFPGRFSDIADEIVQSCATYLPTGSGKGDVILDFPRVTELRR
jgi:hypothetical protein